MGRPIIYVGAADAEVAMLVRETGAGQVVANGDAAAPASMLRQMTGAPRLPQTLVAEEFALPKALGRWKEILES